MRVSKFLLRVFLPSRERFLSFFVNSPDSRWLSARPQSSLPGLSCIGHRCTWRQMLSSRHHVPTRYLFLYRGHVDVYGCVLYVCMCRNIQTGVWSGLCMASSSSSSRALIQCFLLKPIVWRMLGRRSFHGGRARHLCWQDAYQFL